MTKRKKVQVLLHLSPKARNVLRKAAAKQQRTLSSVVEILILTFAGDVDAQALD